MAACDLTERRGLGQQLASAEACAVQGPQSPLCTMTLVDCMRQDVNNKNNKTITRR